MNAIQPHSDSPHPLGTVRVPSRRLRQRSRRRTSPHQSAAVELGAKLVVNVVLAIAAVSALAKLVPYNLSYQDKLHKLRGEVAALDQRVQTLQTDFNRRFDPQQARSIMQEQTNRVDPSQLRVIWVDPVKADTTATVR